MAENTIPATSSEQEPPEAPPPADDATALAQANKTVRAAENTIEQQKKELDRLTKRIKSLEDKDKTDEQRRADELEGLRSQAREAAEREAAANLSLLRHTIAGAKGIPEWAENLSGADEAELEAAADRIVARIAGQAPPTPRPDRSLGRGTSGKPSTAQQFAETIKQRFS